MKERQGFIAPVITVDNHVLGASGIALPVIKVDGDWRKYRLPFESQLEKTFDTFGCTVYGTLKAIAKLEYFIYGTQSNYSERFTYNEVGISPPGSDPHLVATTIRGTGLLNQIDLSDDVDSLAVFMSPRPAPVELRIKALKWSNKRQLGHQWLWPTAPDQKTKIAILKEALTKGTVSVSVSAWYKNNDGLYYSPPGISNGHWTQLEYIDDSGMYVDDSYNDAQSETNLKKLTLDHNIEFAKVYFFTEPTQQQNWLSQLISSFLEIIGLKQKQLEQLVKKKPEINIMGILNTFCNAIKEYEGKPGDRNYKNNNPGNCKFSPVGYAPKYGDVKKDKDGFAIFPTWDLGFLYLENLIKSKVAKHPNWTILDYIKDHAPSNDNNNPTLYASYVAQKCGMSIYDKMTSLL